MTPPLWRVVIADDEPAARRGVRQLLVAFPEFVIAGECRDGAEVLATLDGSKVDGIFLDIQMPGIDGFEVIRRRTAERMPQVIFLTAFDQFALRAFEAEALDYLVKPVSEVRFATTMKRLLKRLGAASSPTGQGILVSTARGELVLPLSEVDWIEAADNYVRLWVGGRTYLLRESLAELERRVSTHGFARAHRQALVRVGGVRALHSRSGGELVAFLSSGAKVRVSRRRRAAFVAAVRVSGPA